MFKRYCLILILIVISNTLHAQNMPSDVHQYTNIAPEGRYEIVQSELAAKWTFRLDRYTGDVSQLVTTSDGSDAWEFMIIIGKPNITPPYKPRFQIFTSGLAARHTFLIDNDTGRTWVLSSIKDKDKNGKTYELTVWDPFESNQKNSSRKGKVN